ncbi:hypothetical protein GQS_01170 [Thermococcus sp. 4557]|uniref:hypothetical protein n=1 Tax=Thermococcus sp. (strain CGMCC 1.5172 / 4557) TaxID=1042877 RepID=UPI000219EA97|nr:hypothetical protein [Thermococcus sp. 4557]AEK72137.1 hypothetical protein GQS_01170 [Thermococcus sp. 4557]
MEKSSYEKELNQVKEWFISLIDSVREEYPMLNSIKNLDDIKKEDLEDPLNLMKLVYLEPFRYPCQIEVFWMSKPCEWQIIVTTHDPERDDKEVIVHGPYLGHEFLYRINEVLNSEGWWKKEFPSDFKDYLKKFDIFTVEELPAGTNIGFSDGENLTYADVFAKFLSLFLYSYRYSPLFGTVMVEPFTVGMYFTKRTVFLPPDGQIDVFFGNIAELDQKKLLEELRELLDSAMSLAKTAPKENNKESRSFSDSIEIVGYAAYLYPPVWVFEKPMRNFHEHVLLKPIISPSPSEKFKIGEIEIEIKNNGMILVLTRSREEARKVINLITSLLTIFVGNANFFATRYSDLKEVYYPRKPPRFYIFRSYIPSDESQPIYKYIHRSIISAPHTRPILGVDAIKKAVGYAETVYTDEDLTTILILFLEAYSHYLESEFNQSFIMGWVGLERLISRFWRRLWVDKKLSKNRKEKLDQWELHKKLEVLELHGIIEGNIYNTIKNLNGKRNDLIHHARPINKGDARMLLDTLKNLLKSEIENIYGD